MRRLEHVWQDCLAADDGEAPQDVIRLLPPGCSDEAGVEDLVLGDLGLDHTYTVSQHLTAYAIRHAAGELLMFHAAGLAPLPVPAEEEGAVPLAVVGIIAASGTGKTTFCKRLVDGFGYVTDETLAIRPGDLSVISYPKPLSVVNEEPEKALVLARHKADHAPAELGLTPVRPDTACRLAALVVAERVAEGNELVPITLAQALELAVAQSSSVYQLDEPLRVLSRSLTLAGGPWLLRFSDQAACGQMLVALAQQSQAHTVPWKHIPAPHPPADGPQEGGSLDVCNRPVLAPDEVLRRACWDDAVESEGSVILLYGRTPVTLGGPGAAVWLALDEPMSLAQAHDRVLSVMGDHPDSWALVAQAAHQLVTQGVLKVGARP
ncbi:hypothetical protein [Actinomyces faecalis]|uniref:hypothetical protein n=1 Tax=Actinomyces faecalis TaxID=2722820 RepID=UPI0015528525|nr:hypothetical protein [Actinomyces faecalis]